MGFGLGFGAIFAQWGKKLSGYRGSNGTTNLSIK
jgi:hypothetical protein